jgi:hypothetical protein
MEKYTGFSGHASLAIVGTWMNDNQIWKEIEERVKINQKVIKHTPTDKMKDVLIHILSGGHGIADINNRVRTDKSLQIVFGRNACAEQSTISEKGVPKIEDKRSQPSERSILGRNVLPVVCGCNNRRKVGCFLLRPAFFWKSSVTCEPDVSGNGGDRH